MYHIPIVITLPVENIVNSYKETILSNISYIYKNR